MLNRVRNFANDRSVQNNKSESLMWKRKPHTKTNKKPELITDWLADKIWCRQILNDT